MPTRIALLLPAAAVVLGLASCAGLTEAPPSSSARYAAATRFAAVPDSLGLSAFLALPEDERAERRRQAARLLEKARELEERERWWWRRFRHVDLNPSAFWSLSHLYGAGRLVTWTLENLTAAVGLDPSCVEAWTMLAHVTLAAGDWRRARTSLEAGLAALGERGIADEDEAGAEAHRDAHLRLALDFAWLCRELGQWEQGLVWAERALTLAPDTREADLVRGLLLAGAGRVEEALAAADGLARMPYERFGHGTGHTDYAARWVRSLVYLHQGEPQLASYVAGHVFTMPLTLPFADRYLDDMGLVAELAGDREEAQLRYGRARLFQPYGVYMPLAGYDGRDRVFGQEGEGYPFYLSYGRHLAAGSLFAYATHQVARCELAGEAGERRMAERDALAALDACVARDIHVPAALSLRGQLHFQRGRYAQAARDLEEARAAYAGRGVVDAWTSLFLGLMRLSADDHAGALPFLRQAVAADSLLTGAWRSLGVALAGAGDPEGARRALDRAIELDPRAAASWYNRGLLACREGRWEDGYRDLQVARHLAPRDPAIVTLLQSAGRAWRREGGRPGREAPDAAVVLPPPEPPAVTVAGAAPRPATRPGAVSGARGARGAPVDAAEIPRLEADYRRDPEPGSRLALARAYVRTGRAEQARRLLAPHWDDPLDTAGRMLLLEADRALGDASRARELARDLDPDGGPGPPAPADPMFWALVAFTCLDLGHRAEGLRALDAAIALDPENVSLRSHRVFLTERGAP